MNIQELLQELMHMISKTRYPMMDNSHQLDVRRAKEIIWDLYSLTNDAGKVSVPSPKHKVREIDYFERELQDTRLLFDLEDVLKVQKDHDIQIVRGEDYQYTCYIDNEGYSTGLTPMFALVAGISNFKRK